MDSSHETQALLQAVLDTAVDAIITIDSDGKIFSANRAVWRILGYESQELIGQSITIIMPEPHRSQHSVYVKDYLRTGNAKIIGIGRQLMAKHKDGRLVPVDLAVSEVQLQDRRLFTGILRDMSERYEAEAVLLEARERLIQSERLAAIGQMVTGLAHESRNALQRSRACLDMLELELTDSPEKLDWVLRIKSAVIELHTLYEEVRNYAAPIKLEKTFGSLTALGQHVWDELVDWHTPKKLFLSIEGNESHKLRFDRHRISQVFRNIFENSIAVSPPGGSIHLSTEQIANDAGVFVETRIRDEGPGMDETQRARVFEPFFTTKTKGTGLGMAIVKRIIDAHGGTIHVEANDSYSTEAQGAEIVFRLPIEG